MGVQWTEEQKKVIDLRDRSILVSAAAGSGKTAVLVERILSKLTDPVHPVSIDRMLIMTFTRAAAGEMKERIRAAVEDALIRDPENAHLQKQLTLIHMAQITTIDGFCAWVLRNYFYLIDLDPGYRVADEGELELLRQDTVRAVLDEFHEEKDPDFLNMLDCFCQGRSDDNLTAEVLKIYDKAMSSPEPEEWLFWCLDGYKAETIEEMNALPWMEELWKTVSAGLADARHILERAHAICLLPGGPYLYGEGIDSCLLFIDELNDIADSRDFDGFRECASQTKFPALSRKKMQDIDDGLKEKVQDLRKEAKAIVDDMVKGYFGSSAEENLILLKAVRSPVETLIKVVRRFMERFSEVKRSENVLDFTDMEHMTLKILSGGENGEFGSAAARELSERFDEVMIDEYQDSNLVQEKIANYVSGWAGGRHNTFMVGDVKQSIYRFRLARPGIFMEKYHRFSRTDGDEVRIDLHKNFRSRKEVLDSVNYLFRQIMGSDLGGIAYGEDEALYPGAVFPEGQSDDFTRTELLMVKKDDPLLEDDETAERTERELEAMMVAGKIQQMVGREVVYDKETGGYRPLRYGDIVILLRSFSGWAEPFMDVLTSRGIPAYAASRSGYFSAKEVVTMLNYLRICDNPRQDIPLAGVLLSPIVSCTDEELAYLRSTYKGNLLLDSVQAFLDAAGKDDDLRDDKKELFEKLELFMGQLNVFRGRSAYTPVHQLIREILRDTGYGMIIKAMPDGEQRSANLSMLSEKAMDYEKTNYHGLFHFIRYIENLHKYEVDYGEVNLSGAGDGAVQLMTIHKSKGLEFPVVFVSGLGKRFNMTDANAQILVDSDMGIACDAVFPERGIRVPFLKKRLTRGHVVSENIGEELRVLYVALTRAKEKLIMTGSASDYPRLMKKLEDSAGRKEELLPYQTRSKAKSYLDFILPAVSGHRCMDELFREEGVFTDSIPLLHDDRADFAVRIVDAGELVTEEAQSLVKDLTAPAFFYREDASSAADPDLRREIEGRFSYEYPFSSLSSIPEKVTVSELKKRSYHEDEELESILRPEEPVIPLVPRFMREDEESEESASLYGSERGTAYHRLMECLDYSRTSSDEDLRQQLAELEDQKKMSSSQAGCIQISDIRTFLDSELGRRMADGYAAGTLHREQPFMIAKTASEIDSSWDAGTDVLVQGIIDAYFREGDEIILVDYKTDHVSRRGGEQKLLSLYRTQMEEYAEALERLTGKKVKEKLIWSFALGKTVQV